MIATTTPLVQPLVAATAADAVKRHSGYKARLDLSSSSVGVLCGAMTIAACMGADDEAKGIPEKGGTALLDAIASEYRPFHRDALRRSYMAGRRQARILGRAP